jgi:hypothetical protein
MKKMIRKPLKRIIKAKRNRIDSIITQSTDSDVLDILKYSTSTEACGN